MLSWFESCSSHLDRRKKSLRAGRKSRTEICLHLHAIEDGHRHVLERWNSLKKMKWLVDGPWQVDRGLGNTLE